MVNEMKYPEEKIYEWFDEANKGKLEHRFIALHLDESTKLDKLVQILTYILEKDNLPEEMGRWINNRFLAKILMMCAKGE